MIDALVGYGQFGMAPMGGGIDRGPFIVGWRSDAPPTTLELDGADAQRYSQTIEVISGRPSLGPGQVQLDPLQLSAALVSTDGDASANDGESVFIGNGTGTFSISLPLEAFGLEISGITIVGGNDPSMLSTQMGNMPGMFPAGYQVEIQDVASGEWMQLGDLSQTTQFNVEDPASVLDAGGRMTVRVVGAQIDPSFGQMPIWLSAAVQGEL